ncbi:MAG: glycerophosphodiester phosphodiesterase, partial [Oligoflexales bacterium]|nr:glycerophosphodiester phosphodiesterase [Oligoflexales bacterium]
FPDRASDPVSSFTYREILTLDAGSWFNESYPDRARNSYNGLKIATLEQLINIAEGKNPDGTADKNDGGNRPGLYLETKKAFLFPGIEKDLHDMLEERGWLTPKNNPALTEGRVNIGEQKGRLVLQTFQPSSLPLLNQYMPDVPKTYLVELWDEEPGFPQEGPDMAKDLSRTHGPVRKITGEWTELAKSRRTAVVKSKENFRMWIEWAKANGATGTGPSMDVKSGEFSNLVLPWMNDMTHELSLYIHAWTIDEMEEIHATRLLGIEGIFTNRADVAIRYFKKNDKLTSTATKEEIFRRYGF